MMVALKLLRASFIISWIYGLIKYRKMGNDRYFDVRSAGEKGIGLFTTIRRRKGELVFIAAGPAIHAHFTGTGCYDFPDWYGVDRDIWIDIILPWVKINHSCDPNTGIDGFRCFRALRDIKPGEEVTFDYSTSDDEMDWEIRCCCGESDCNGSIGPIQMMPAVRFKKAYPYIPKYFQRLYRERNQ